jgi:hypothetical protein
MKLPTFRDLFWSIGQFIHQMTRGRIVLLLFPSS